MSETDKTDCFWARETVQKPLSMQFLKQPIIRLPPRDDAGIIPNWQEFNNVMIFDELIKLVPKTSVCASSAVGMVQAHQLLQQFTPSKHQLPGKLRRTEFWQKLLNTSWEVGWDVGKMLWSQVQKGHSPPAASSFHQWLARLCNEACKRLSKDKINWGQEVTSVFHQPWRREQH